MGNKQAKEKADRAKILFLIFSLAVVLRVGGNVIRQEFVLHKPFVIQDISKNDERTYYDAVWYIEAAKGFLIGNGVVSMSTDVVHYNSHNDFPINGDKKILGNKYYAHRNIPPLYPVFLAWCYYLGGVNTLAFFIPQLFISALTCVLIYLIAEELFNRRVALLAGVLVAFYPDLIFWMSYARTETLFMFLLALGFLLLIKGNSQRNIWLICISSIVLGLACLTRVTLIFFLPALFIWQGCTYSKDKKESFKIALSMVSIVSLTLLPWAMRNYALFGHFTVFSEEAEILTRTVDQQFNYSIINTSYNSYVSPIMKTVVFIKDNTKEYLISCGFRFAIFWSPFTAAMRPLAKLYKGLWWLIIFPASIWGTVISRKKWKSGGLIIVLFIAYHTLLHTASFMDAGLIYRYPIQPFLCIFAAYGYCFAYERLSHKSLMK